MVFAGLFVGVFLIVVVTVGPLWDQVTEFVDKLPEYWDQLTQTAAFDKLTSSGAEDSVRSALEDLAKGLPDAANTLLGSGGRGVRRRSSRWSRCRSWRCSC